MCNYKMIICVDIDDTFTMRHLGLCCLETQHEDLIKVCKELAKRLRSLANTNWYFVFYKDSCMVSVANALNVFASQLVQWYYKLSHC